MLLFLSIYEVGLPILKSLSFSFLFKFLDSKDDNVTLYEVT